MPRNRIILLLIFFFVTIMFAQKEDSIARHEVYALILEADHLLEDSKISESLETSKKALNMAYSTNQLDFVAMAYNTIAGCHENLSEIDKALEYYYKSLHYAEISQNDLVKDWANNNIGNIYNFDKKNYAKSIEYYQKSLAISTKQKDTLSILFTKLNLSWAYFNLKKTDQGYEHLKFVEENLSKYYDEQSHVIFHTLYGIYFSQTYQPDKADQSFKKAIFYGKRLPNLVPLADAYEAYSKHLYQNKRFEEAYTAKVQFTQIKQTLFDKEILKNANFLSMKIELEESKREISKIESENILKDQTINYTRTITILALSTIIVLLLLFFNFYKNNNYRKDVNIELVKQNSELELARKKAEEAAVLKRQFISTISHEIRTPLYGVVGITDLILEDHPELANSSRINSLKFSGRYLLFLVDDLLKINKIDEHKDFIVYQTFNLLEQIQRCETTLEFFVVSSKNKVIIECDPAIPEVTLGDKCKFSQILLNILNNSLKFTQNGTIYITATIDRIEGKIYWLEFTVEDTGCGIAEENQEKVFEEFVQIDRREGGYKGTGLGLSIVKRLVDLLGGTIKLESKKNVGTKIAFTCPFIYDMEMANAYINNLEVDITLAPTKYKILVVEDNKINQIVTQKNVEKNGHLCKVVDDGFAALDLLKREKFDLILMDINMPMINGFETTRLIREIDKKIPIVALTAYNKEEVVDEARDVGMNDVLIKPFDPKHFFDMIHNYVAVAS